MPKRTESRASNLRHFHAAVTLLCAALGAACAGGGERGGSVTPPPPAGTLALSAGATTLSVAVGASSTVPITVSRGGSFSGPVTLTVEGAPAGVTASLAPATVEIGATASTLTVGVGPGMGTGNATLTVRARGTGVSDATAVVSLAIAPAPTVNVTVSPLAANLAVGATQQFQATVTGSSNTGVTWSSSQPGVAAVSSSGLVTGVAPGIATIRAQSVADPSKSASVAVTITTGAGSGTLLTSGTPMPGLSGAEGSQKLYRIVVPAGASRLEVQTTGGTGDVDLYLRQGQPPAAGQPVACASEGENANESCVVTNPAAGDWYVLLVAFETYSGVTLTATVSGGGTPTTPGFTLLASPSSVTLAPGGTASVTVTAARTGGFTGAVTVSAQGLPTGVTASTATIAAGATSTTLTLSASSSASGSSSAMIRGQSTGVADATTALQVSVSTGSTGTLGLTLDDPSLRIEQNNAGWTLVRIARNGYTGPVDLSIDTIMDQFVIATLDKTTLSSSENTTTLIVRLRYNHGGQPFTVRVRAKPTGGTESVATLSVTVQTQFAWSGGFTMAQWEMYMVTSAGDRCEYNVSMTGNVTVTVNGLDQGGSMTTRVQGTLTSSAKRPTVGNSNCNSGTTTIDETGTAPMIFPFLGGAVVRKFTSWQVKVMPDAMLDEITATVIPGNTPRADGHLTVLVTGSSTAGLIGSQPAVLPLSLLPK